LFRLNLLFLVILGKKAAIRNLNLNPIIKSSIPSAVVNLHGCVNRDGTID